MTSFPKRDPKKDPLLTSENAALLVIDYQPTQINSVNSMNRATLIHNIVLVAKIAKLYKLPIVLSTVNAASDKGNDTIPVLKAELYGIESYDRTAINAFEDKDFYEAVKQTDRKKLVMTGLWTEACVTMPTLDALKEGFEVYPVVDAIGGTSSLVHKTALRRMEQAGASPITLIQMAFELQRDWARQETATSLIGILREAGIFPKMD